MVETETMEAHEATRGFLDQEVWDHRQSEHDLLEQAKKLMFKARLLDPYSVTSLHRVVSELPGGVPVAEAIVSGWIEGFKAKKLQQVDDGDPFHRPVHALIQAELDATKAKVQSRTTALEACLSIARNSGWGPRQEIALKSATVAEFDAIIRSSDIKDMQVFMRKMLELTIQKDTYEHHFGSAMDRFVEACKNIAHDPKSSRLGKLIKGLFASAKLEALLEPSAAAQSTAIPEVNGSTPASNS